MKNLITILLIALVSFAFGQKTNVVNFTSNGATLTNSGSASVTLQADVYSKTISVQAKVTKTSGTIAGTGILYGTLDGTNYVQVNTDTLSLTDQTTNTKIWIVDNNVYKTYKITFVGSGTMAATVYGYALSNLQSGSDSYVQNLKSSYGFTSDTVTNSATNTIYVESPSSSQYVSIQAVVTKISGTVAGTVTLKGSLDGTNYVTVNSSYATVTTLSCSNQTTNTKIFVITGSPYRWYKLSYTGSGTMSATLKGYIRALK